MSTIPSITLTNLQLCHLVSDWVFAVEAVATDTYLSGSYVEKPKTKTRRFTETVQLSERERALKVVLGIDVNNVLLGTLGWEGYAERRLEFVRTTPTFSILLIFLDKAVVNA